MEYFTALSLILGLGACDGSGDWCGQPVGKVALNLELVTYNKHSIHIVAEHMSDFDNGSLNPNKPGEQGLNVYLAEYKYDLFKRK